MNAEELKKLQKKILSQIEMECKEALTPAVLEPASEDLPVDILRMVMYELSERQEEAMGEFAFLNLDPEMAVQIFSATVILTDVLELDHLAELYEAAALLNTYIPYGGFCVSPRDHVLAYKLSCPLTTDLGEDQLYAQANIQISSAFLTVDKYMGILLDISEGESLDLLKEITGQNEEK